MSEWLEHMPAIPLARGVPVIDRHSRRQAVVFCPYTVVSLDPVYQKLERPTLALPLDPAWAVDLDDAGGFAYALRYLLNRYRRARPRSRRRCDAYFYRPDSPVSAADAWGSFKYRALTGEATDDDRVVLAKALREVTS